MKTTTVKPIPAGYHTITPYLVVKGVSQLISFLEKAFGAKKNYSHNGPDGKITHAEVKIGDSMVMIGEARESYTPTPCMLYLYMEDVDAAYKKAMDAGAESISEPKDQFYGDRSAGVKDPCGNQWWIATHVEDVSNEEMEKRMAKMAHN